MTGVNYDKRYQTQNPDGNLPAQAHFLTAIAQLNPEVLLSLKALSNAHTRSPTRRELKQWARKRNLGADWMVEWFAHTIKWQREGPSKRWDRFYHPRWSLRSRFERRPATIDEVIKRRVAAIDFGDWLGDPGTRSTTRRHAASALQRTLRESLEEVGAAAIASGLFEARRRRSRGRTKKSDAPKRSESEPFLWLAGYQTRGWSRERIADAVDVTRNAVAMRIGSLAADLKIKLRPNETHDKSQTAAKIRLEIEAAREYERAGKSFLDTKI